ncbi:MAG: Rpn family recombination-promoting nuclease/putative transposase [Saprospiraceae bacterium]|jgi:predicted transposase/invertase (TIGR01784 family)|nr:Rpn family recombination-promoting nuclease/putative transposase [Saprospiraceae bacterium]
MSRKTHKTHDSFVRELLSKKDSVIEFLKHALPQDVQSTLDLENIKYDNSTYTTIELNEYISDIVLKVPVFGTNGEVRVAILIEQKSTTDHFTSLELLTYMANGYTQQQKRNETLSIIIPVLYFQGKDKLQLGPLDQLYTSLPEEFRMFIPTFQIEMLSE